MKELPNDPCPNIWWLNSFGGEYLGVVIKRLNQLAASSLRHGMSLGACVVVEMAAVELELNEAFFFLLVLICRVLLW